MLIAEFEIKGLPDLPNRSRYRHWAIQRKGVVKWQRLVMHECYLAKISGLGLNRAVLSFERHSSVEPDFDNIVASFKGCQDALIKAGVIIDDKQAVIGQPSYKWVYRPRKQGGLIKIRIEGEK